MTQKDNIKFRAIGSPTRLRMLEILAEKEMHISGLARELDISVPVAARHVNILEDAGLIQRKEFGRTHILNIKLNNIYNVLDGFASEHEIEMPKGKNLLDALQVVSAVELRKVGSSEFVVSTDGDEGLYIYEVNGKLSDKTVREYVLEHDVTLEWKKLTPVTKKKISIKVK